MTNDEGDHCEKKGGSFQNSTTLSVEYSREGSKVDVDNPSEAVLGIWVCNVPAWEHKSSALWAVASPSGNARPRGHDASPNPRVVASWPCRSLTQNCEKQISRRPKG